MVWGEGETMSRLSAAAARILKRYDLPALRRLYQQGLHEAVRELILEPREGAAEPIRIEASSLVGRFVFDLDPARLDPEFGPVDINLAGRPDEDGVSRLHAYLRRGDRGWTVEDCGSRHGTYLNGQRLEPGRLHALVSGDDLRFGKAGFTVGTA
ncbi:MAG: FHA domain-containing protein [Candidatus Competibacteraceae bacterium]|nr:MAG: FHA domain-containing protein [Candidatus Competibacteraceae bacterium]